MNGQHFLKFHFRCYREKFNLIENFWNFSGIIWQLTNCQLWNGIKIYHVD